MKRQFVLFILLFTALIVVGQIAPKRKLQTQRINQKITIDGVLDEAAWANAQTAKDFVFRWPTSGKTASEKTEVKVMYDDFAMYIGAKMYDTKPDSILKSLTKRDNNSNCDWFYVTFDTYMDGQNGLGFGVTAANVQFDIKYAIANANLNDGDNADGEDINWDAVWKSSTKLLPDGWVVEMEIPYSALRFPKKSEQSWHINFFRRIFRKGETDAWNEIKATETGSLRQSGILEGIKDIKMPLRLQASPFVAVYGANFHDKNASPKNLYNNSFNAGMDIKYGINEAFTLDATIIPDFGQVRSDNQIVNLSPFEVRFDEFRPFFMEGTELFNKGGLFYSRRIGGRPLKYYEVQDNLAANEEIVKNPSKAQLYNSTKISGRTTKGTGVGVLNAIQAPMFATIRNKETNKEYNVETSPLTNYNVTVIDQNLKNNSSIALINTSVLRAGSTYDANVTGLNWNLKNKKNSYGLSGDFALSQIHNANKTDFGHKFNVNLSKLNGNWTWGTSFAEIGNTFNPTDMGYQQGYNWRNYNLWGAYNQYKPKGRWNNYWVNTWAWYSTLQNNNAFTESGAGFNVGGNTKNFYNMGINMNFFPTGAKDYFEPRTFDFKRYFYVPQVANVNIWFNSDNRKKIRYFGGVWGRAFNEAKRYNAQIWGGFVYQMNNKFRFSLECNKDISRRDIGYAFVREDAIGNGSLRDDDILFGRRNINGFDNTVGMTYTFNNKANLTFRMRHYWQQVKYSSFFLLQKDGTVTQTDYNPNNQNGENAHNLNGNFFNIDCVFTWRFAPGSDLFVTWKNATFNEDPTLLKYSYFGNTTRLFRYPQENSLNVKMIYFLDYAQMKRKAYEKKHK